MLQICQVVSLEYFNALQIFIVLFVFLHLSNDWLGWHQLHNSLPGQSPIQVPMTLNAATEI